MSTSTNKYLPSNNVRVFPYGQQRNEADPYGRILNEANIARMIRSLTDNESYIISAEQVKDKEDEYDFKIIIHGYYFELTSVKKVKNLFAVIFIDESTTTPETLIDGDINNEFKGLALVEGLDAAINATPDSKNRSATNYLLLLFDGTNNVCAPSFKKFNGSSVYSIIADCGTSSTVMPLPQDSNI